MVRQHIEARIDFHAVGQGLFATGSLRDLSATRFRWVYDCGTTSKQILLQQAIECVAGDSVPSNSARPHLDLVFLSHFDRDHISGMTTLLGTFRVGTLVLPYLSLPRRIELAFAEGVDTQDDLMLFFVNPVEYLTGRSRAEIERILFVLPSVGESPTEDEGAETSAPPDDSLWGLLADTVRPPDGDEDADARVFWPSASATAVEFLRAGGRIRIGGLWEFVPYNDPDVEPKPTARFRRSVVSRRDAFLSRVSGPARNRALASLRNTYDRHFGRSAKARNEISLFVYTGSIGVTAASIRYVVENWQRDSLVHRWYEQRHDPRLTDRALGVLYTGDGFLNTPLRLKRLTRFLGDRRLQRISCMQVMHHGARGNWHPGVAATFSPSFSVFSSDPNHKGLGHPHAEVVRDFLSFGPLQVDARRQVSCRLWLETR